MKKFASYHQILIQKSYQICREIIMYWLLRNYNFLLSFYFLLFCDMRLLEIKLFDGWNEKSMIFVLLYLLNEIQYNAIKYEWTVFVLFSTVLSYIWYENPFVCMNNGHTCIASRNKFIYPGFMNVLWLFYVGSKLSGWIVEFKLDFARFK